MNTFNLRANAYPQKRSWKSLLGFAAMLLLGVSQHVKAQSFPISMTKASNTPSWNVGQIQTGGAPFGTYTIRVENAGSSNTVRIEDELPQGIWPGWTGTRTTAGFSCTQSFTAASKRHTVVCTRVNTPTGNFDIELPVWVDQLAVGSVTNTALMTQPTNSSSNSVTTAVQPILEVPSQLTCTNQGGSLGVNLFTDNGTFGALSTNTVGQLNQIQNPGPALPAGSTTMIYAPTAELGDGLYRLSNRLAKRQDVPDSNWFWTVGDHTSLNSNGGKGDPNQLMMVMNANHQPGIFYSEVLTVQPHTNYEFSNWAIHANNPNSWYFTSSPPLPFNLILAVDRIGVDDNNNGIIDEPGEAQVISSSGKIPAPSVPTWRQYAAVFYSGEATQVRFIFRNNGPGGPGNDLAIDDLVMARCDNLPTGDIRGRLYFDDNRNGVSDSGEDGLPANISVELVNSSGQVVATVQTNAAGEYEFPNIGIVLDPSFPNANNYVVRVVASDPDIPPRATLGTPNNVPVTVVANATQTVDFGFNVIRLLLQKQWDNAEVGDAVEIVAISGSETLRRFNAVATSDNELNVDATAIFVLANSTIMISETFTVGTAADYEQLLTCTGAVDTNLSNGLQVNAADRDITCTYTNTRSLVADLSITKTSTTSPVTSGGTITYSIVVTNNGPSAADNAVVSEDWTTEPGLDCSATAVPPGTATCAASGTAGTQCPAAGSVTPAALQAGLAIPALPNGGVVTFTLTCAVTATGTP